MDPTKKIATAAEAKIMMRCVFTLPAWRVIAKNIGMAPTGFVSAKRSIVIPIN